MRMQDLMTNIYAKEYIILALVGFFCVLALIGSEVYFINASQEQI